MIRAYIPQALQIVCPFPARLQSGVVVVPQLAQLVAVTPTLCSLLDPPIEFFRDRGELDAPGLPDVRGGNLGEGVMECSTGVEVSLPGVDWGELGEARRLRAVGTLRPAPVEMSVISSSVSSRSRC